MRKKGALSALLITPGEHLEDWDTLRSCTP